MNTRGHFLAKKKMKKRVRDRRHPSWCYEIREHGRVPSDINLDDDRAIITRGSKGDSFASPLGFAVLHGDVAIVETLIRMGADVNKQCFFRPTNDSILSDYALCNAVANNNATLVKLLLENGADYRGSHPNAASWAYSMKFQWNQGSRMFDMICAYDLCKRRVTACVWVMENHVLLRDMSEITTLCLWAHWDINL
jgi:hypothetical protein